MQRIDWVGMSIISAPGRLKQRIGESDSVRSCLEEKKINIEKIVFQLK